MPFHDAVKIALHDKVLRAFAELWKGFDRILFVDVPDHPNIGDSLIFQGELAAARQLGKEVAARAFSFRTYNRNEVAAALTPGTALTIHGGGNLGPLYPHHQDLRFRVTSDFRERLICQAPQSIYWGASDDAKETRRWIASANLRLAVRDEPSYSSATDLRGDVLLSPDAFHARSLTATFHPKLERLIVARRDTEATQEAPPDALDWPQMHTSRLSYLLDESAGRRAPHFRRTRSDLARWEHETSARMMLGVEFIQQAREVVTDRLHVALLAFALDRKVTGVSSLTGKLEAYYDTWLRDAGGQFEMAATFPR